MGSYLSDSVEVAQGTPVRIKVKKDLGVFGKVGYVISDDGSVDMQVSEEDGGADSQKKIRLDASDQFIFEAAEKWKIGEILLTTTSTTSLTCRYFIK